ncbi:hypothetical protein BC936DRAFT_147987 [Jimgerdemannia flammicorona]|uniref:Arf-GAP domain-containing protein n=1 Tax=Jimgerdemannia flammicorona TaxID=994334 RepID=A0A433D433_9FUNG|nr:hypothetical protein BC936DRAFT_147987 [Jimgerdemannia flammicorona]
MSTRHARTSDRQLNEKHNNILKDLLKKPANKFCADCKRKDPRWASWNIGVFMCIRCSGVHRSLGTHISKVKSVDLDIWTPEQIESITRWGNARANNSIESWIKSKYEYKRWAMKGPIPDPRTLDDGEDAVPAIENAPEPPKREQRLPSKPRTVVAQPNFNDLDSFLGNPDNTSTGTSAPQLQGADLFGDFASGPAPVTHSAPVTPSPSRPDTPSIGSQPIPTSEPTIAKHNDMKSSILSLYNNTPPRGPSPAPPNMSLFVAASAAVAPSTYTANLSTYQQQLSGLMTLVPSPGQPQQQPIPGWPQGQQQTSTFIPQPPQQQNGFGYGVQTPSFAATLPPQQQLALHSAGFTPMLMPQGGQFFAQGPGQVSVQQPAAKKDNFNAFADIANFGKQ